MFVFGVLFVLCVVVLGVSGDDDGDDDGECVFVFGDVVIVL